jgi:hypothetical protein
MCLYLDIDFQLSQYLFEIHLFVSTVQELLSLFTSNRVALM